MNRRVLSVFLMTLALIILMVISAYTFSELKSISTSIGSVENLQQPIAEKKTIKSLQDLQATLIIGAITTSLLLVLGLVGVVTEKTTASDRNTSVAAKQQEADLKLQRADELLQKANEELASFSYTISHDLKAPLRAIAGFSKILFEEHYQTLDDSGRRAIDIIQKNAARMDALINDLLTISRLTNVSILRQRLDMSQIVNAAVSAQHLEPHVKVVVHPLSDSSGDPQLIRQVWEILVSNAVKFSSMRPEPKIEIGSSQFKNGIQYWIRDNGTGFDMNYKGKLFKIFSRLHNKKDFEGTGAGLAIARKIIEAHGGEIRAEAEIEKGATFLFSLPS